RRRSATAFMVVVTAINALVHLRTGRTDIVIGTVSSYRPTPDTEQLIGLFVNALVLRTDLSDDPTLDEVVTRTRRVCLDAYANRDIPWDFLKRAEPSVAAAEPFRVM